MSKYTKIAIAVGAGGALLYLVMKSKSGTSPASQPSLATTAINGAPAIISSIGNLFNGSSATTTSQTVS